MSSTDAPTSRPRTPRASRKNSQTEEMLTKPQSPGLKAKAAAVLPPALPLDDAPASAEPTKTLVSSARSHGRSLCYLSHSSS